MERNTVKVEQAVKAINASEPDAVVMISQYTSCAEFIRQMKKAGSGATFYNVSFVGSTSLSSALGKEGIGVEDLDLIEINEAFASVAIQSMKDLGVTTDKVNVNGGAIALGHPIGMSGARVVLHLALELQRRGGGTGAAALCGGGGQGDALIIKVPQA